jgi:uncharacterized protein
MPNLKISKMLLFFISFFIVFLILFSLFGFWTATHPPRHKTNISPKDFGFQFEEVTLTTSDNIKLGAWFVESEQKSDRVIIVLHGYPFDKTNILGWASFLQKEFNLFLFDFRYFGDSEGSMTTVGFHEQKDLEAAIDYLEKKQFDVGLMGFSLGGAVAIMTAANDERIKAVVSDSAYANLDLMMSEYYKNLFVLKYPLALLTNIWSNIFVGISPNEISPEKEAKNLKIPILVIHSKKDQVIPFENALRIQKSLQANKKAQFYFIDEGSHGIVSKNIQGQYQKKVLDFFRQNL